MSKRPKTLLAVNIACLFFLLAQTYGQQSPDYFDFWSEGNWVSEITVFNKDTIPEKDSFIVRKMSDKNAFLEEWKIFIGDGEFVHATAIRAFDQATNKWKLFYVDDLNAQTWDSQLLENKVYFFKEFNYNGKKFYSRQAWAIKPDGKVLRTIDRSEDNKNWSPRYWQIFKKVNN